MNQNYFRKADSLSTSQQISRTLEPRCSSPYSQHPTIPFHPLLQRSRPISVFPFHCFPSSAWFKCRVSFKPETIRRGLYGHCFAVSSFTMLRCSLIRRCNKTGKGTLCNITN